MTGLTFRLVSLGCAKNLVDSESLAGQLIRAGWRIVPEGDADLVAVNTCAFVEDAAQESVDTLLAEIDAKAAGHARWLAAVGCLPQKYGDEFAAALGELDLVVGTGDLGRFLHLVERLAKGEAPVVALASPSGGYDELGERLVSTPRHRAYLKIAEGCDNACAYCIIGRLRGPFRSRAGDTILDEARRLVAAGARELSLVAQDLTLYGRDLTPRTSLPALLRALDRVRDVKWIRLLYAHPARVDLELARTIAECEHVVPYLDMPIQHADDAVLARMHRAQTRAGTQATIDLLRRTVPDLALRTTFLVGHPGETESAFAGLLDFIRANRFEHVGAFAWSPEEGTPSYEQGDWVPAEAREERLAAVMELQQRLTRENNRSFRGREVEVLVETIFHQDNSKSYTHGGRLAQQAPEVDSMVYLRAPSEDWCRVGDFVRARITDADAYELFADAIV